MGCHGRGERGGEVVKFFSFEMDCLILRGELVIHVLGEICRVCNTPIVAVTTHNSEDSRQERMIPNHSVTCFDCEMLIHVHCAVVIGQNRVMYCGKCQRGVECGCQGCAIMRITEYAREHSVGSKSSNRQDIR